MTDVRDHLTRREDRSPASGVHRASETITGPSLADRSDPRLAHGGAAAGLMRLQQTAGNAAVSALVAPAVQRAPGDDAQGPHPDPGAPQAEGFDAQGPHPDPGAPQAAAGPVTSDGATTTISGAQINLEAAMTTTSGVIRAGTIIADNVVGSNYTPGAGNVW